MPELPEVETVRRGLQKNIVGRVITDVILRRKTLREPLPRRLGERLHKRRIAGVGRRGKTLLISAPPETLLAHLGMSGGFSLSPSPPAGKHAHVAFALDGVFLIYTDARRFGRMALTADDPAKHAWLRDLGPEPLTRAFTGKVLSAALAGKKAPIKTALMDGRVLAGVGNIYASESLFAAGIRPQTPAGDVDGERAAKLAAAIKQTLRRALRAGGSSMRDFTDEAGRPGYFQTHWAVYGRAGMHCVACDALVRRVVMSGRSSYYCPRCQS